MIVQQIAQFVAPWHDLYADSKAVSTATESAHLVALLLGGGFAVAADRTTLRVTRSAAAARASHLGELGAVHRPVLIALSVMFVSGVGMALADIESFVAAPAFWVKLGMVTLLLANGAVLTRTERRLGRATRDGAAERDVNALWARLRFNAQCSLALWALTVVAGSTLMNTA